MLVERHILKVIQLNEDSPFQSTGKTTPFNNPDTMLRRETFVYL